MTRLLSLSLLVLACGDPLAPASYPGEPLLKIAGTVEVFTGDGKVQPPAGEIRLAIFRPEEGLSEAVEDPATSIQQQTVTTSQFPTRFELAMHTPPPPQVVRRTSNGTSESALGLLLVYIDRDGDGRWTDDKDVLAGGAPLRASVWTPKGTTSTDLGGILDAGYHSMTVSQTEALCSGDRVQLRPDRTPGTIYGW